MSLALMRSQRNGMSMSNMNQEFESDIDRDMREAIKNIGLSKQKFLALDAWIRQIMNLPKSRTRSWLVRSLSFLIPKRFYPNLPDFVTQMVAEEFDALVAAEGKYRTIANDMQSNIKGLVKATKQKGEQLNRLIADIETARSENWSARKLHEYILRSADLKVDPEVSELLDDKFNILGSEEKELKKQRLLLELEGNVTVSKAGVDLNVRSCLACLEVFEVLGVSFYNFVHNYKPAAALRDAAISLVEGGVVMHSGREAIAATYKVSLKAIDDALEAARKCREHSIVSVDMVKLLETGSADIDAKLRLLASEDSTRLKELALPETVEVTVVN